VNGVSISFQFLLVLDTALENLFSQDVLFTLRRRTEEIGSKLVLTSHLNTTLLNTGDNLLDFSTSHTIAEEEN